MKTAFIVFVLFISGLLTSASPYYRNIMNGNEKEIHLSLQSSGAETKLQISGVQEKSHVVIYNSVGLVVGEYEITPGTSLFSISILPAGTYSCLVKQNDKSVYWGKFEKP